jgi:type IV pilus assembly protein PilB
MVMSTLHTNDAPATLTRMVDMGIKPFAIATAVNVITAQRLARRLHSCKTQVDIPAEALLKEGFTEAQIDGGLLIHDAVGCDGCSSGFKGRVGIYQVMELSDPMKRMVMEGKTSIDIADQSLLEGIPDIRMSACKKVADGMTSIAEMNRVTQE